MPRPAFGSLPKVPLAPRARVLLKSYLQDTSISANLFRSQWILCFRFVRYISLPPKRTSSIERTRISWPLFVHTSSNRSDGARASSFDRPKAFLRIGWSSISGNAMASILWYSWSGQIDYVTGFTPSGSSLLRLYLLGPVTLALHPLRTRSILFPIMHSGLFTKFKCVPPNLRNLSHFPIPPFGPIRTQ